MIGLSAPLHGTLVDPRLGPDLVTRVLQGDRDARRAFFESWAPRVLRWCRHLGGPSVDAEDAAHDVLVTALTRLPTLRRADRADAWMFGITRRVLAGHRRTAWVRRWLPGLHVDPPDPRDGPHVARERSEVAERVRAALAALPPELREVLVLCDMEERSDEDAAAILGLPVGTAKSRLRRARARFHDLALDHAVPVDLPIAQPEGAR